MKPNFMTLKKVCIVVDLFLIFQDSERLKVNIEKENVIYYWNSISLASIAENWGSFANSVK